VPNNPLAQESVTIPIAGSIVRSRGEASGSAPGPAVPEAGAAVALKERHVVAREIAGAAGSIQRLVGQALGMCVEQAALGASLLDLERAAAKQLALVAQRIIAFIFASACEAAMLEDLRARGLTRDQIRLRADVDGYATVHTTFGLVTFPIFAYRDLTSPGASVTHYPAHKLLPFHRACRSSPLCLEWEVRLGAEHPFRKAEELFHFFTRGASTVEDTTISRHILVLSSMVDADWLYRKPDDIRQIVQERATRDKTTGQPLVYFSSDAHALRRYVGVTWETGWKMVNGIRLWCEDAATGQIIHLGGEFTWGDCHVVGARIGALIEAGILPNAEAAWQRVHAQVVFISDGADWLKDYILPHVPDAVVILDPYHVMEWFSVFIKVVFGSGSKRGKEMHAAVYGVLLAKVRKHGPRVSNPRCGHKKTPRTHRPHAHSRPWLRRGRPRTVSTDQTCEALVKLLADLQLTKPKHLDARADLVERLEKNARRMDYVTHLARGLQVGSGAMESMHRNGSQRRLKVPGARWLEETSQAVLTFRMLELSGRWDEFWRQADLCQRIGSCFHSESANTPNQEPALTAA